ncbi:molecular chaperone [Shewanella sp. YIC-542]|uniref:TorD/DmsD family molecular chaperone n=1 Tax=Shewanella mytili TaxID=3377111 RepID=UPI00398EB4D7
MTREQLQDLQAIGNLLHSVLTLYPTSALLQSFKTNELTANWPLLSHSDNETIGLQHLATYLEQWQEDEQALVQLKLDYGQLFYGPGTPVAPPWGSVYLSQAQLLNDASTMALKSFYTRYHLQVDMTSNEPLDHIGLLMAVLAFLLGKLSDEPTNRNLKNIISILLAEHLLPWADRCLELAQQHAHTGYFKGFSLLGREYLFYVARYFGAFPKNLTLYR